MAVAQSLEAQIHQIGGELAGAFPSAGRHPLRALDEKAMELASRDAELRAALFRFVDVVPACRSLEDLSRHLSAYLHEVGERPPPLEAAMRMADTKAGA
jgi:proline dehydrogenase